MLEIGTESQLVLKAHGTQFQFLAGRRGDYELEDVVCGQGLSEEILERGCRVIQVEDHRFGWVIHGFPGLFGGL